MAEIVCNADNCKYWQNGTCSCVKIEIGNNVQCVSYVYYKNSKNQQTSFWKATYDGRTSTGQYINYNVFNKETR